MSRRPAFRPSAPEALEDRVVQSQGGLGALRLPARTAVVGPVGALGDSFTDEYRFYPPDRSAARNWVEILQATRHVSFGPLSTRSRGEPRNQGFADNWARSDATSSDMVANQLPGLAAQAARGQVKYAWIFIGGNDYLGVLKRAATGQLPAASVAPTVAATGQTVAANFRTAVDTLLASSPDLKLVVSTLPDVGVTPAARLGATLLPQSRPLFLQITQSINAYNATIAAVAAANPRVALVDLAAATQQLAASPTGTAPFGGTTIDLVTPGDDYHHFFLADAVHVGTVGQGIIAQQFAQAVDAKFGANLTPPTPRQILRLAASAQHQARR